MRSRMIWSYSLIAASTSIHLQSRSPSTIEFPKFAKVNRIFRLLTKEISIEVEKRRIEESNDDSHQRCRFFLHALLNWLRSQIDIWIVGNSFGLILYFCQPLLEFLASAQLCVNNLFSTSAISQVTWRMTPRPSTSTFKGILNGVASLRKPVTSSVSLTIGYIFCTKFPSLFVHFDLVPCCLVFTDSSTVVIRFEKLRADKAMFLSVSAFWNAISTSSLMTI